MKKIVVFSFFLSITFSNIIAHTENKTEDKFNITIATEQLKNTQVYLAHYYEGQPYTIDSTNVYKDGKYELKNVVLQPQGEYLIYIKPNVQLPLMLGYGDAKDINIKINDIGTNNITIDGSKGTSLLWDFNKNTIPLWQRRQSLNDNLQKVKSIDEYKTLATEVEMTNDSINNIIDDYIKRNTNSIFATYLRSKKIAKVPYPTPLTGEEKLENLNFIRSNFWKDIDLNQEIFWNGPDIYNYIQEYLYSIVSPEPDSIAYAASEIASRIDKNKKLREKYLTYMVNKSGEKKYVGQENIWAKLAEDYIIDKDHSWVDSIQYQKLMQEYAVIKNNRIGNTAKNIKSISIDDTAINTDSIDADYTILYFYSPTCGHCATETPVIHDLMAKYKNDNVKVVAFNTTPDNKKSWTDFIEKNKMEDWINVSDPNNKSSYWLNYDVRGVPSIYVLDKNKKILIKNIATTDLEYILDLYLKKQ